MFCYFAPVTRHSFQAMCTVFSRRDFLRLFDCSEFSPKKPMLNRDVWLIWAAMMERFGLWNTSNWSTFIIWQTLIRIWLTPFGEPNNFFGKPILSFEKQLIPFGEPSEKQMISGMGTETSVMRRWSIQHSMVTFT